MGLIKFFNMICIIIICSYIGIIKAQKYELRVMELNKFQNALIMLKTKMQFTYEPIKNIFEEISKVIYKDEENIFKETAKFNEKINENWEIAVDNMRYKLNKEDLEIIKMFGKMLGKTDIDGQVNEILITQNLVEKQILKAEDEKQKNSKMYKSIGVIGGLGICVILV